MTVHEIRKLQAMALPLIGNVRQAISLLRAAQWHCKASAKREPSFETTFGHVAYLFEMAKDEATKVADDIEKLYAEMEMEARIVSIEGSEKPA